MCAYGHTSSQHSQVGPPETIEILLHHRIVVDRALIDFERVDDFVVFAVDIVRGAASIQFLERGFRSDAVLALGVEDYGKYDPQLKFDTRPMDPLTGRFGCQDQGRQEESEKDELSVKDDPVVHRLVHVDEVKSDVAE